MEHGHLDYDKNPANSKGLLIFLLLFVLVLALVMGGIAYLTKTTRDQASISGISRLGVPFEVEQLKYYEETMLNEYGVIDSEKGLYRIPIDKAMEKVIEDYR